MPKVASVELVETKVDKDKAEKSKTEEITKMLEILSPSREATMPKTQKVMLQLLRGGGWQMYWMSY
jgi:hypothetical protein